MSSSSFTSIMTCPTGELLIQGRDAPRGRFQIGLPSRNWSQLGLAGMSQYKRLDLHLTIDLICNSTTRIKTV